MKTIFTFITLLLSATSVHAITPNSDGWFDSYSVEGKCYIESSYDHGAGDLTIQTPQGPKTVREIAEKQFAAGRPYMLDNPRYNDVQCGNGPANNAGDEDADLCPGRVDIGEAGCQIKGPFIDVVSLFPATDTPTEQGVTVSAAQLQEALNSYAIATKTPVVYCSVSNNIWSCSNTNEDTDPIDPDPIVVTPPVVQTEYTVVGNTLTEASELFAQGTNLPRKDCDPLSDGRWLCSSMSNPELSDVSNDTPTVSTEPVEQTSSVLKIQAEDGQLYSGAGWSIENGLINSEGNYIVWRGAEKYRVSDSNLPEGILAYEFTVTEAGVYSFIPRVQSRVGVEVASDAANDGWVKFLSGSTVPEIRGDAGTWLKFYQGEAPREWQEYSAGEEYDPHYFTAIQRTLQIGTHTVLIGGRSANFALDYIRLEKIGTSTPPTLSSALPTQSSALPTDSLYQRGDFVSVHFDTCPDADDFHAATATKMVLGYYDLKIDSDYAVVNGTCGWDRPRNDYNVYSPQLFNQVFGSEGSTATWLNAYTTTPNTVDMNAASIIADKWRTAIEAGRNVWVLDGGPHDFTAVVIQIIESQGIDASLKRINVVQHSRDWNGVNTNDANLALVLNRTTYHEIDNGNTSGNGTAALNQNNNTDYYPDVDQTQVARFRNDSKYGSDWAESFLFINPDSRIDFSDTVEALHIFRLDSWEIPDIQAFADKFTGQ